MSMSEKKESESTRKAYHSPVIRHYGAIGAITEAVGMTSMNNDGAAMAPRKTS